MIDWIFASKVAGFGFLAVFIVLGILSLAVWLVSLIMYKTIGKNQSAGKPGDAKPKEEKS
jgi:Na+-transporting methylmalonyl-CoA/oxaloacetate decarboxylase gamma subunit